jgi:hypothetical protein
VHLENIGAIVVAGEVVPQLGQDPELEIAVGIENALLGAHRAGDDAAVGRDDNAAAAAVGIAQEFLRRLRAG